MMRLSESEKAERETMLEAILARTRKREKEAALRTVKETGSATLGHFRGWTIRVRAVKCGKPNCKRCPHKFYAYAERREKGRLKTRYLGVVR